MKVRGEGLFVGCYQYCCHDVETMYFFIFTTFHDSFSYLNKKMDIKIDVLKSVSKKILKCSAHSTAFTYISHRIHIPDDYQNVELSMYIKNILKYCVI